MVSHKTCEGGSFITHGILPSVLPLKPMGRISPSQFSILKKCKLRAIWASSHVRTLLPVPPAARLGTVIHKILENVGKGSITGDESFDSAWSSCVQHEEVKMNSSWTEKHLIPLEKSAHNYEVKKQQCLLTVQRMISAATPPPVKSGPHKRKIHEVWLQTPDGKIGGYADAIVPAESGDVIIDYKTGSILESGPGTHESNVRENYQIQLKLYAALYNSMYGRWPASLKVAGIDGVSHEIQFSPEECSGLLDEARQLLTEINFAITDDSTSYDIVSRHLASPSPGICQFCLYRPCCPAYWKEREAEPEVEWPNDVKGILKEKKILRNGLMLIKLTPDAQKSLTITVNGLHPDRHPALAPGNTSDNMVVISMGPYRVPGNYREGLLTTIYTRAD